MLLVLSAKDFGKLFTGYERSAWRLETLPAYDVPEEADDFARFLAGESWPEDHTDEWLQMIATHAESGRTMGRVHALRLPLTDYLRFEIFTGYVFSARAGEDVRILDLDEHPADLPTDFWIFDDRVVVGMAYGPGGAYIGAEFLPEAETPKYLAYRDTALAHAEPLAEFLSRIRTG
jgi:hypothetical protein